MQNATGPYLGLALRLGVEDDSPSSYKASCIESQSMTNPHLFTLALHPERGIQEAQLELH